MIPLLRDKSDELTRLCRNYGVARLEVFGSASEDFRFDPNHSDVDFLVEFLPEAEPHLAELYLDFIAALRDLLERDVDLVMTRAIRNPYFLQVVDRSRRTLYAA